jgi:hypothetical protein
MAQAKQQQEKPTEALPPRRDSPAAAEQDEFGGFEDAAATYVRHGANVV